MKSNITYVDTSCQVINNRFQYYETILGSYIKLLTKADKLTTYFKTDVNVFLSILQAGIDRKIGSNLVDLDGKFKLFGESNDIFKIQKIDGSTLLELSYNSVDKSILNINNIDILASINNRAVSNDVYNKVDID